MAIRPRTARLRLPLLAALGSVPGLAAAALEGVPGTPPAPALSAAAPDLTIPRGRVVLVNFWASWCPPCIQEMPSLDRLAGLMTGRPFRVLAVNVGESQGRAAEALRRIGYRGELVLDPDQAAFQAWGGRGLPTSFLVGCDGRLRYAALGPLEWDGPGTADTVSALTREPGCDPTADGVP